MQFEISHEFDAPIDTIELAVMSPDLGPLLGKNMEGLESVEPVKHDVAEGEFRRVWRFQARSPLKVLRAYNLTREMLTWEEHSVYRRDAHTAEWYVVPRPGHDPDAAWRKGFSNKGTYQLDPLSDGRTRRTVVGEFALPLKLIGGMLERIAVAEVRKAYEAEAVALRSLCSLD